VRGGLALTGASWGTYPSRGPQRPWERDRDDFFAAFFVRADFFAALFFIETRLLRDRYVVA